MVLPDLKNKKNICKKAVFKDPKINDFFEVKIDYLNSKFNYKNFIKTNKDLYKKYFNLEKNKLFIKKNNINIGENLFIPGGMKVMLKPNQKIILSNNAFIFSKSPWIFNGKKGKIFFGGIKKNMGGGLLITDTNQKSEFNNVIFSNLTGYPIEKNFEHIILGSVNFNQTSLELRNVEFNNIFSEDAINIFRSDFKIINSNYVNIESDAIDIDFSNGQIKKAKFTNIKNDAIDFSGSEVVVIDTSFTNVDDKLISAGEGSDIKVEKISAKNSYAGIVSKDGSVVYSNNIIFDGVKIPFAAYQKKNEYEYPEINLESYNVNNYVVKAVKDKTSKMENVDNTKIMKSKDILALMYKKKLSLIN